MSWLLELARPEIRTLRAYAHASWEPALTRLHANELPWRVAADGSRAGLNRYPEPHPHELTAALARHHGVPAPMLLPGRGSDELIDLLIRAYCRAGKDAILICPPTFGMYAVAAHIQGALVHEVPLRRDAGWALDEARVRALLDTDHAIKLVFVCSPNNPTGNSLDSATLLALARSLEGRALVVLDEAYVEFAPGPSLLGQVAQIPGLVVLRTLSKAYGLAGARCGLAIAHPDIISLLQRIIPPYALTQMTIEMVLAALQPEALAQTQQRLRMLASERARLREGLQGSGRVLHVWPSDANFLLVEFADAAEALARAHAAGLLLRDFSPHPQLPRALRISVGSPEQNERLLACLS